MSLSIITPHFNDFKGLQHIYSCLQKQTVADWEWIIVDDLSDLTIRQLIKDWYSNLTDKRVNLISNTDKTNASICRNIGANSAMNEHLVFLDADDIILPDFVENRQIDFADFAVFQNIGIIDKNNNKQASIFISENYLDYFLKARFIWQTTAVLWNKSFFIKIGQFDSRLSRLQDVELSIRALQNSTNYKVLNNSIDFHYHVIPIRERKNFVKPVCEAVYIFISELLNTAELNEQQLSLLSGYYYLSTRYLERSESTKDTCLVQRNLKLFYKKGYIRFLNYIIGIIVLKLYALRLLSGKLFLRINRYLFKPK